MKTPCVELLAVPDYITVTPFGSGFGVACDLCDPRRTRAINWHPDKRPASDRCADYLVGHLRTTHRLKIDEESALAFVNRATPKKAATKSVETPKSSPFSPYSARL